MAKIIKIIAGVFVIFLLTIVAIVSFTDINQYKGQISKLVHDATNRNLEIDGDIAFTWSLVPTLLIEDATFSNARWGSQPTMVKMKKLEVELALIPLLSGDIDIQKFILINPEILLEKNTDGEKNWVFSQQEKSEQIKEDGGPVPSILLNKIEIENGSITYIDKAAGLNKHVDVDLLSINRTDQNDLLSLILKLTYNDVPISFEGDFGSINQLTSKPIYPVDFTVKVDDATFGINGDIAKTIQAKETEIDIDFDAESLKGLAKLLGIELPDIHSVSLAAKLSQQEQNFALTSLNIKADKTDLSGDIKVNLAGKRPAISVKLDSSMLDLVPFIEQSTLETNETANDDKEGADFKLEPLPIDAIKQALSQVDLSLLLNVKQLKLPTVTLSDTMINGELRDGRLTIKPVTNVANGGEFSANVVLSSYKQSLNLAIDLSADSLADISLITASYVPDVGQLKLSARAVATDTDYSLNSLSLHAGKNDLSGDLQVTLNDDRPEIKAQLASNLLDLNDFISDENTEDVKPKEQDFSLKPLPIDEIEHALTLFDADITWSAKQIKFKQSELTDSELYFVLKDGHLTFNPLSSVVDGNPVAASFNLNTDVDKLNLTVNFETDSLAKLSALSGIKLPDLAPIKFAANVSADKQYYTIEAMRLVAGKSDLLGEMTAKFTGKQPDIKAKLSAKLLDLTPFSGEEQESNKEKKSKKSQRVFSAEPFELQALHNLNANIEIHADKIKTSSLLMEDSKMIVNLNKGNLTIKPLRTLIAGGQLAGNLTINTKNNKADLSTDIVLKGLNPNTITDLSDIITGAKTDLDIKVNGQGGSVRELMAGLDGKFTVKVGEAVITDSISGALGADVITNLVNMVNPFSKSQKGTDLKCAVINFDIKDGIATANKGIAISTAKMNIIGIGDINLKNEKLDISITPEAKEGFGLNAGKLASLVKLSGTLADPKPAADLGGTLTTGVSVGTAVATGGLSLLAEGLLDRATADINPCDTALGIIPPSSSPAVQTTAPK